MPPDLRAQHLHHPVDIAQYLFRRLQQVGVDSIHGVPGDYNLVALDYISRLGLRWVGNCNELNAGYAADGYARVKGVAALVTTFGVGELSAANAIAGAYSEYVPVVHIVGYPSTLSQKNGALLHHTLGNGDFTVFSRIFKEISCAVSMLNHQHDAATLIDNAIRECILHARPVYISLPSDMVQQKVDGDRLNTPLDLDFPPNDPEAEEYVVDVVLKYLGAAKNPAIVVDGGAIRHRALDEVHQLVAKSGIPTFVAPLGKGAVDETLPNYGGVYAGDGSNPGVKERVESADLVLSIGSIQSDFNTAGFTVRMSQMNTIDFHSYAVKVRYSTYPGVRMNGVLSKVTSKLTSLSLSISPGPTPSNTIPHHESPSSSSSSSDASSPITHAYLWPRLGQWLQPNDIILTETGTSNFGIWNTRFPANVTAIAQVLWGSIGYATAACQGACLAAHDQALSATNSRTNTTTNTTPNRTILFTGDGSLQLTAQEISTMLRHSLNPILFVICNKGYTIERLIHGMHDSYNDIQDWNYAALPAVFGARDAQCKTYCVRTRAALDDLLRDDAFASRHEKALRFVELHMPWDDAPAALKDIAENAARTNAKVE
ncbi:hypothetical protein ACEQ8H_000958 [Pleosporales sp. CAS-2024a]